MREYINKGKCIWCLRQKPEITFHNSPHAISRQLKALTIGLDICDSCNEYFGKTDKTKIYPMSIELAFKEIMGLMQLLLSNNLNENTYKNYKSTYFEYYHSKRKIKIRKDFELKPNFIWSLTRQFKKGIYEIFLQEYHRSTLNGLDEKFNSIRKFVREDIGNLPIYFLESTGAYFVEADLNNPTLTFSEKAISDLNDYGFYTLWMFGNIFYLEVTPRSELSREVYLRHESSKIIGNGFFYSQLKELKLITDIDFTLRKLYR